MRRLLLALLLLMASASAAFAQQSQGQLCYTTNGANCVPVGTQPSSGNAWGPLPIAGTIVISGNSINTIPIGSSYQNITTNTDTEVKNSSGTFVGITVNTAGTTSTAKIYDDADGTCSSNLIATVNTSVLGTDLIFNAAVNSGICVTTAGAGAANITILYR